jgi:hypothetical protein
MGARLPAVLVVSVAVLAAGAVAASAGSSGKPRTTRLTVTVHTTKLTLVDTGPTGSSPGDMVLEDDSVTRGGRSAGSAQFTCVAHSGDLANGNAQCTGTVYLAQGQIETQGDATSTNGSLSGKGAVTGGTGRYHGVRGSYTFRSTTSTDRVVRFRLVR